MSPSTIFGIQLVLGYVPWLLVLGAYVLPGLRSMDHVQAQRAIATLHSFRFFGLVFLLPGVVSPGLPAGFAPSAAYGDFATGILAMLALLTIRVRPLFFLFVVAFNVVGAADLLINYYHGARFGLPERAGDLAAAYWIPILYVPVLMITHVLAFYLMVRHLRAALGPKGGIQSSVAPKVRIRSSAQRQLVDNSSSKLTSSYRPPPISSLAMLAKWRNVMGISKYDPAAKGRPAWNAGKQVDAKRALKVKQSG